MHTYRIVMVAPFGIRPKGTLLARMLPLAQALVRRGHRVGIVAPPINNPEDASTCHTYAGVPVLHTAHTAVGGAWAALAYTGWLLHPLLAATPDIVYLFKPKGYGGLAVRLLRGLQPARPVLVDTDDWEGNGGWNDVLPYPPLARRLFDWQEHDLPRHAHAVTAASRTLVQQVQSRGVPAAQVFYLPNGVAAAQLTPSGVTRPAAAPLLLLYTRFWEFQVPDLVTTLCAIHTRRPDVRVLVLGKGERGEQQTLLQLAQQAGIATMLDYRGWVAPQDIPALLQQATLALMPLDDTLINRARCSAKLLEMLAAGVPVVGSNVGQMGEYIRTGDNGWLVPPGDPLALAHAVLEVLQQPERVQHMQASAPRSLEPYLWDRLAVQAEAACACALRHIGG